MQRFLHHTNTIDRVIARFAPLPEVEAVLLVGSIAHGYARETSDVDIMVMVDLASYEARQQQGSLTLFDAELATYEGGYVDGKITHTSFVEQVASKGSDAARYAFKDAQILYSRIAGLPELLREAARFPKALQGERIDRFLAQFEAWNWYAHEALRQNNRYLLGLACSKLALFGARLVLTCNERLFPYHKWLLRELAACPEQPDGIAEKLDALFSAPDPTAVSSFYEAIMQFKDWPTPSQPWTSQFMHDSELNWLHDFTPVDDL